MKPTEAPRAIIKATDELRRAYGECKIGVDVLRSLVAARAIDTDREELEEKGYELIKPVEGMCFVNGEWQRMEATLYRLIEEEE